MFLKEKFKMMTPQDMIDIDDTTTEMFVFHMNLGTIETKMHHHTKSQLLYAEGGIIHIFINDKHWYLPARCFMLIPAGIEHSILTFSKKVSLYNFYFKEEEKHQNFYGEANIYYAGDLLREMILHTKHWKGKIDKTEPAKYYFLKALKENIPLMETTKVPIEIQHPFPKDPILIEIAHFLNQNLEKNYTIEEVAKEFGLSTRTLSRKFKENVGISYVRFLRSLRITKALELISENQYNMYEVAMMVGYNSLSSFSNIFYKIAGIRPTEYAQRIK